MYYVTPSPPDKRTVRIVRCLIGIIFSVLFYRFCLKFGSWKCLLFIPNPLSQKLSLDRLYALHLLHHFYVSFSWLIFFSFFLKKVRHSTWFPVFFFNAIYAELSECLVNKLASVIILFPFEVFGYTLLGKSNSIVPKRAHAPNLFHLDDCCSNWIYLFIPLILMCVSWSVLRILREFSSLPLISWCMYVKFDGRNYSRDNRQ